MESQHAPAFRIGKQLILDNYADLKKIDFVQEIIDALPYVGAILNQHRQIVYANKNLLEVLGLKTMEEIVGGRPGEVLHCINSAKEIGGCGTSEACRSCGAVNTILKSSKIKQPVVDECRIISDFNGENTCFEFKVTSVPFEYKGSSYTIFSLVDISHEKRKRTLERIFFHDIINRVGSLSGFIELIKNLNEEERIEEYIHIMEMISNEIVEEILLQKDLAAAENGELKTHISLVSSMEILESIVEQIKLHEVTAEKSVVLDVISSDTEFKTDAILLKRILLNMLKNALEAVKPGEKVSIGTQTKNEKALFWVHNNTYIEKDIQYQIFQRSFSTKATDRGLGTYSMKLLGEKYLKGKVYFTSEPNKGTYFFLQLPSGS